MNTNVPEKDEWLTLATIYETWPTEKLKCAQRIFQGYLSDPIFQRNPGWLARCVRPNLGLVTIILLLR